MKPFCVLASTIQVNLYTICLEHLRVVEIRVDMLCQEKSTPL